MSSLKFYVYTISLLFSIASNSWGNNLKFKSLDINDGLPFNSVRAIVEDREGNIWFGTDIGLARYDGYNLRSYDTSRDDPTSLTDSYILDLEFDDQDILWITTDSGLHRYNKDTDDFTVFQHDPNDKLSLSSNKVTALQYADNGSMWVATRKGLDLFDITKSTFTHFQSQPNMTGTLPDNNIRALLKSSSNKLYVGTGKGLVYFNSKNKSFDLISLGKKKRPTIRSLVEDKQGLIWIGTLEGLFVFDPKTSTSEKIEFDLEVEYALSLSFDSDDNLWIGTFAHGLFRIDPKRNITNIRPDKSDASSLSDKTVLSLLQDQSGQMWVGTRNSGINLFSPKHLVFGSHNNSTNSFSCLPSNDFRSALAMTNDSIILGTLSGMSIMNLSSKRCDNYFSVQGTPTSLSDNAVYTIFQDSKDSFWVGVSDGLDKFLNKNNKFIHFGSQIDNSTVYKIIEHNGYLILATDNGLYKLDLELGHASPILDDNNNSLQTFISNLNVDSSGVIWIASDNGLYNLDKNLNHLKQVQLNNITLTDSIIRTYLIDSFEVHWLTIEKNGLFKYFPKSNKLIPIGKELKLPVIEGFAGLYEDSLKNVWLATKTHGLFKISKKSNKLVNYRSSDGLHSELFNFGSFTQFPDGRLFFGGRSGFNIFHPEKIKLNTSPPIVSLTQLKLFGKKVTPFQQYDGFKINKHVSNLDKLELSHRETVFGFDFVANHHLAPKKIKYFYQLEGFDKDWIETSAQNRGVTYNNISPGEYIFKLKAKTHNDVWSKNDVALKVKILPAPWLTWWAFTIYGFIVLTSLFLFIKNRTRVLELRAIQLKDTVTLKTKQLVEEKHKVEQLLSRKNEEFANVSHEFRTPLTLILGPLAQVIKKIETKQELHRLNIVQRNGYRLLRMVDQLLNLETFRVKSIAQKSPQAIGKSVKLITEAFADLATEKQIQLSLTEPLDINFEFTPDAFEKILLNLLSNAIKYSKPKGTITVQINRTSNNQLKLAVSDTGIGIPQDKLDSIFERYNRILDENSEQVTGAGIGLALVKELVEAHGGTIKLQSELGKGTSITIYLPIIGEVSANEVNVHSNNEIVAMELMSLSSQTVEQAENLGQPDNLEVNKPSILIIEDNSDMREYICNSISYEYQILTARDGEQGVKLAVEEVPDLIISDIMMPKMDGYQTTNALRNNEITNHIPIILLTARGDRESRLKGWYEKADEYLTKPFDVEELRIRVKNLLSIRDILKKRFSESVFDTFEAVTESDELSFKINKETTESDQQDVQSLAEKQQRQFVIKLNGILENIYQESELTIPQISKTIAMSDRQFFRKLKNVFDITPIEYLRRYRLEKAKLLLDEGRSVNYAAIEVGFTSQSYFGRCFKAQFGISPRDYKKTIN